jgi:hypothetical protein
MLYIAIPGVRSNSHELDRTPTSLIWSMILSEKSATFRDHALRGQE